MGARKLTADEEALAFEYALQGLSLVKTAKALGFKSDLEFLTYRRGHPVFAKELEAAREASCPYLEDRMLEIPETIEDPKSGRIAMEVLARVLSYRNPARYGNKVDINMNQTISLKSAMDAADTRLLEASIDVTPKQLKVSDIL